LDGVCVALDVGPLGDGRAAFDPTDLPSPDAVDGQIADSNAIDALDETALDLDDCGPGGCDAVVTTECRPDGDGDECAVDGACDDEGFGCRCGEEGLCVPRVCQPDATYCDGADVLLCDALGASSSFLQQCADDELCVAGGCVGEECAGEDVYCIGDTLVQCGPDGRLVVLEECAQSGSYCDDAADACRPRNCTPGVRRCTEDAHAVEVCDARGIAYEPAESCGEDEICRDGVCRVVVCSPAQTFCLDERTRALCDASGVGYTPLPCAAEERCVEGDDGAECIGTACTPGATRCLVSGLGFETCNASGTGFGDPTSCGEEAFCQDGECFARRCTPGFTQCLDSDTLAVCNDLGSGYEEIECGAGRYCDSDSVPDQCRDQVCEPDSRRCLTTREAFETCDEVGAGYLSPVDCAEDEFCDSGDCRLQVCVPDSAECLDDFTLSACDERGAVEHVGPCPEGHYCDSEAQPDQCRPQVCVPSTLFCNEADDVEECDGVGASSEPVESCDYACLDGVCQPPVCGDGYLTPSNNEACDDGNDALCDGCEACQRYFALAINTESVRTGSAPSWQPEASDLTLEAWVFPSGVGRLFGLGPTNQDHAQLFIDDLGRPTFQYNLGGTHTVTARGTESVLGGWHHLAGCRFGEDNAILFVDGELVDLVDEDYWRSEIDTGGGALWIGSEGNVTAAPAGLDEIRISNICRYAIGFPPPRRLAPDGNTEALYHLDEGEGGVVHDASARGRNLEVANVGWWSDDCYGGSDASARCGDGLIAPWEDCDDGDTGGGDGCSSVCHVEIACSDEGAFLGPYRDCYLHGAATDWPSAEATCVEWGGHLATIEGPLENQWLDFVVSGGDFWIGLNDRSEENVFVWVSGSGASYRNWNDGEPNNVGGEDCTELLRSNGRWNDLPCGVDNGRPFLCER
jgi:cysteine-rich repeat protein